ncbi:MAG: ribokinase [Lachnospiraceae bacterium]|jgi:ribokinase|nr:ribokinase [Lachnospiraceae bacterium]
MKILNFGSLNIDYVYSVEHFLRGGETLSSDRLDIFCGGKGLNQSVALKKSGIEVYHAGALGESDGAFLLDFLDETGVNLEFVRKLPMKSGHAIIQKNPEGQNCIMLYGGANQNIERSQVDAVLEHFEEGDFIVLQNEISEIGYIMEKAHEKGLRIVLNPSPMDSKIFTYPLDYVELLILNEIEAGDLLSSTIENAAKIDAEIKPKSTGLQAQGDVLIKQLSSRFRHMKILLTLGDDGSIYRDADTIIKQGIYRVDVVDTTAAGDTFTGFFIGAIAEGKSEKEALELAAKAASISVSRQGAAPSIPDKKEVLSWDF